MRIRFTAVRNYALTRNAVYEVQNESRDKYYVINDAGNVKSYTKGLFEVVEDDAAPQPVQDAEPVAPVENAAQRRAREAREEAARQAEQERREEARRIEEENRRGRIWTEQDVVDSISVTLDNNLVTGFRFVVRYNIKKRLNDRDQIVTKTTDFVKIKVDSTFSCGVNQHTGIQAFLRSIHNMLDYQDNDYELLRTGLFTKIGQKYIESMSNTPGDAYLRSGAFDMCSVITNNFEAFDYREVLINNFGFVQVGVDRRNPNSPNDICVLMYTRP